jgi:hypothetical protein
VLRGHHPWRRSNAAYALQPIVTEDWHKCGVALISAFVAAGGI